MNKKIAIITAGELPIPPIKGGAVENLIWNFMEMVGQNQDFEVDIYGIGKEKEKIPNVHMRYYESNLYLHYLKIAPRLRNKCSFSPYLSYVCGEIKKRVYDFVIVENRFSFLGSVCKCTNATVCLHMHNSHLQPYSKEKEQAIEYCDLIIAVSDFVKNEIVKTYPQTLTKTVVWHNGVDVERFSKTVPEKKINALKAKYGIEGCDKVIAYTGRIIEEKGVYELIRAFQRVKKELECGCKLMLIGSSWYGDKTKMTAYERKVFEEASKTKDIVFTGYIDNSVLPEYLAISDALVYPSLWNEPFGLTIVEGLSTGKPVISFANGGIPEIYAVCDKLTQNLLVFIEQDSTNIIEVLSKKILLGITDDLYSVINYEQINNMKKYFSKEQYYKRALELFYK